MDACSSTESSFSQIPQAGKDSASPLTAARGQPSQVAPLLFKVDRRLMFERPPRPTSSADLYKILAESRPTSPLAVVQIWCLSSEVLRPKSKKEIEGSNAKCILLKLTPNGAVDDAVDDDGCGDEVDELLLSLTTLRRIEHDGM